MTEQNPIDALRIVLQTGSEDQAFEYINTHFAEFPEEFQQKVALALYMDGLREELAKKEAILGMKEKLLQLLADFDAADAADAAK